MLDKKGKMFATPIKIPFFEDVVNKFKESNKESSALLDFGELN